MRSLRAVPYLLASLFASTTPSKAQSFDIHAPVSPRGVLEFESINGANLGSSKGDPSFLRHAHELKLTYGLSDAWRLEVGALLEWPESADARLARIALENIFVLHPVQKYGVGLGLFAGLDVSTHQETHNSVTLGPIVQMNAGAAELLVNPFFERSFGQNAEPGFAFNYLWHGKIELTHGLAFGAVGYGRIENLGSSLPLSQQDHRAGPALFVEVEGDGRRKVDISLGLLAGLTEASPSASVMLNVGIPIGRR